MPHGILLRPKFRVSFRERFGLMCFREGRRRGHQGQDVPYPGRRWLAWLLQRE